MSSEIDRASQGWARHYDGDLEVVQVKTGCVYLSAKLMCPLGALCRWVFSLSLETMKLDLLVEGRYDGPGYPYIMAWPPSLVGDDQLEL